MQGFSLICIQSLALMIKYTPASQLTLEGFKHPFDQHLDDKNRWVKLAALIPWDKLAGVYCKKLRSDSGRESVDARCVIAAIIVKHKLKLSDRETVQTISENIYLQYFCGYASFRIAPPFDASLLVDIRKRMGVSEFDVFHDIIVDTSEHVKPKVKKKGSKKKLQTLQVNLQLKNQATITAN